MVRLDSPAQDRRQGRNRDRNMTEMKLKPALGEQVHYFDPSLATKAGFMTGYGGRKTGPYVAIVTNDLGSGLTLALLLPEYQPFSSFKGLPHKDDAQTNQPYWDWKDPLQKGRAQKRADAGG